MKVILVFQDGRTLTHECKLTSFEIEDVGYIHTAKIKFISLKYPNPVFQDSFFYQDFFKTKSWKRVYLCFSGTSPSEQNLSESGMQIRIENVVKLGYEDEDEEYSIEVNEYIFYDKNINVSDEAMLYAKDLLREKATELQRDLEYKEYYLNQLSLHLNKLGVHMKDSVGEYRSAYDIFKDLSSLWEKEEKSKMDSFITTGGNLSYGVATANTISENLNYGAVTNATTTSGSCIYGITSEDNTINTINTSVSGPVIPTKQYVDNEIEKIKDCLKSKCSETKETKEDNSMSNIFNNVFGDVDFGKITSSRIKYSMNGIAFADKNGKYLTYKDNRAIDVTGMTIDAPLFAMPVAANKIATGDIIRFKNNYVIVKELADDGLKVINPIDGDIKTIIPELNVFNFNYYTKIISPFESMGITANEDNPFGNFLPFIMFSEDTNKGNDGNMLKYMMLSQMCGGTIDFTNPMMMYMLMDDKKVDPMTLMFMNGNFMKVIEGEKTK